MKGQTTIEPCAICGEPSIREVEIAPPQHKNVPTPDGPKRILVKATRKLWLCPLHVEHANRDRGWQQREADARAESRKKLKRDQLGLEDAA